MSQVDLNEARAKLKLADTESGYNLDEVREALDRLEEYQNKVRDLIDTRDDTAPGDYLELLQPGALPSGATRLARTYDL